MNRSVSCQCSTVYTYIYVSVKGKNRCIILAMETYLFLLFVHYSSPSLCTAELYFLQLPSPTGEMSRSDYPPGYDDSRGPLYAPQGGNYPPPPAYGFPAYGGSGQPSAPYPTEPNAPMYPGQPGGYPSGPYPGQPHPAGPQGAGYPPMPPVIPPTIPSDILSSGKTGTSEHISVFLLMGLPFFKICVK